MRLSYVRCDGVLLHERQRVVDVHVRFPEDLASLRVAHERVVATHRLEHRGRHGTRERALELVEAVLRANLDVALLRCLPGDDDGGVQGQQHEVQQQSNRDKQNT